MNPIDTLVDIKPRSMEQALVSMRVNCSMRKWSYSRIGFATCFGVEVDEKLEN